MYFACHLIFFKKFYLPYLNGFFANISYVFIYLERTFTNLELLLTNTFGSIDLPVTSQLIRY